MPEKRVAIVYDWADTRYGGAERVLTSLHELYPQAELFTSFVEPEATWTQVFPFVHTSFLQNFPGFWRRRKKWLAPFLPLAFESFNFDRFSLIFSVSSFAAKGIITKDSQLHVNYLLTPTRFLYSHTADYFHHYNPLTKILTQYLRRWDQLASTRPDKIIAISQAVAERAQEFYRRPVDDIIYPTIIDTSAINKQDEQVLSINLPDKFFLCVGRLTPYKHLDLVVQICGANHWPLVVIGDGPQRDQLEKEISRHHWDHIHLISGASNDLVKTCYQHALALVAPGLEDFGINLLEANYAQTLVVTHPDSGARELLDRRMCVDLDPADLSLSLETTLSHIYEHSRRQVPRQNLRTTDFRQLWREKVGTYEKMFL